MSPRIALATLALLLAQPLAAQVYKWRDADGKLHFTDTPPPQSREVESPDLQVHSIEAARTRPDEPAAGAQATTQQHQASPSELQEKGRMQCSTAIARMPSLINETQKLGRDGVRKQKITQDQLDKAMYRMDDFYKGLKRNERECLSEYLASDKSRTSVDCLADTPDVLSFGQCMQFADWAETFR
ncbi:DUF4124 domain-containing protein [Pseudomonas sp. BN417]|uniref:DUF4124 domain-containing protein n=1 Tax=Pseudomonas sp. BN417 TaxID=2567890 RepID=UPI002456FC7E|nr:DUF4124 domain-containing protein [Pseudomonas sp. BN417]MDH4558038.1 DUF4124 domain-containing protein [Pseudomonas sp. BN417]